MTKRALECVIPHPVSVVFTSGNFFLKDLHAIRAEEGLERFEGEALDLCRAFGIKAAVVHEDVKEGVLCIGKDPSITINKALGKSNLDFFVERVVAFFLKIPKDGAHFTSQICRSCVI